MSLNDYKKAQDVLFDNIEIDAAARAQKTAKQRQGLAKHDREMAFDTFRRECVAGWQEYVAQHPDKGLLDYRVQLIQQMPLRPTPPMKLGWIDRVLFHADWDDWVRGDA